MSSASPRVGRTVPFATLYDLSDNLDVEWIHRELGIASVKADEAEILEWAARRDDRVGVIVTDPRSYRTLLSTAPPASLVVLHLYDGRYTRQCHEVATMPSVFRLYRAYSLERVSNPRYIALTLASLRDARIASTDVRQVGAAVKSGNSIRSTVRRYNSESDGRFRTVPLGYTAVFASEFTARFGPIDRDTSLFDHVLERGRSLSSDNRTLEVSFRGARGQFQRRTGVHLASKRPRSDCSAPVRAFSGKGKTLDSGTYVDLMTRSRFALCPPGFSTNESYRTSEALLCGALPVMLTTAVSQGTRPPAHLSDVVMGPCWTTVLRSMERMDEPSRRAAVLRALHSSRTAYREAADSIRTALSAT